MNPQYRLVNNCLELLRQKEIPSMKKLRLEIDFCRIKRLLLNNDVAAATDDKCVEWLQEVHRRLSNLQEDDGAFTTVEEVSTRLQQVIRVLARATEPSTRR